MSDGMGKKPELKWISVDDLMVDSKYQRSADGDRSKSLIGRIARDFHWSKFGPLIVSRRPSGKYAVIDGQHRLQAALLRGDIEDVPCSIVPASDVAGEAESFIGINRDRVKMTSQAMFYALVGSGDKDAVALKKALDEVGVSVPRYPTMIDLMKPKQCQAVGALQSLARNYGLEHLKSALSVIIEAYPDTPGQMRSSLVKALTEIYGRWGGAIDKKRLVAVIADNDPESLDHSAREYTRIEGGSIPSAVARAIVRMYNEGLKKADKLLRQDGE